MVKSKWSYKKFMVEIRNRNELRGSGSKRITRVKTDYAGRNEIRGSKRIIKLETNYEGQKELRNYVSIREIISYLLNIIYTHYKLKKNKKKKINVFFFSSRRRHTRSDRDWSSDVCSSD